MYLIFKCVSAIFMYNCIKQATEDILLNILNVSYDIFFLTISSHDHSVGNEYILF